MDGRLSESYTLFMLKVPGSAVGMNNTNCCGSVIPDSRDAISLSNQPYNCVKDQIQLTRHHPISSDWHCMALLFPRVYFFSSGVIWRTERERENTPSSASKSILIKQDIPGKKRSRGKIMPSCIKSFTM